MLHKVAFSALLLFAFLQAFGEELLFRAGPLSLDLPSTWHFKAERGTIEGKGPNGETVIVSVRRMRSEAPEEVKQQHMKTVRGFARDAMPNLASKNGEVIQPVTETELPEGRFMFSAYTKTTRLLREGFFLQYLLASPSSMVYLTVEGTGNAKDAAEYFSQVIAKHTWTE